MINIYNRNEFLTCEPLLDQQQDLKQLKELLLIKEPILHILHNINYKLIEIGDILQLIEINILIQLFHFILMDLIILSD